MVWVGRNPKRPPSPTPVPWVGTSCTRSGCSILCVSPYLHTLQQVDVSKDLPPDHSSLLLPSLWRTTSTRGTIIFSQRQVKSKMPSRKFIQLTDALRIAKGPTHRVMCLWWTARGHHQHCCWYATKPLPQSWELSHREPASWKHSLGKLAQHFCCSTLGATSHKHQWQCTSTPGKQKPSLLPPPCSPAASAAASSIPAGHLPVLRELCHVALPGRTFVSLLKEWLLIVFCGVYFVLFFKKLVFHQMPWVLFQSWAWPAQAKQPDFN